MSENSSLKLLEFLTLVGKLKHMPRTGWVLKNVQNPETISGHMYRMAMMTFLLPKEGSPDRIRCMEMALVHDLAESIIGDITPHCGISLEDKHLKETKAMEEISQLVGGTNGQRIYDLFMEYENQETDEAKFVRELDLFDMRLQAFEYEKVEENPGRLQEFISSTEGKFSHPLILHLEEKLGKERSMLLGETQ